jgi:signal transduction histidine kinase
MDLAPEASDRLESAVDDLDTTVREIRTAIFELHSSPTGPRSVRRAAAEMVAESARTLGFEPSLRIEGAVDQLVDDVMAEHLLSVEREALSNVARHAKASAVDVVIELADGWLSLTVTDDGVGPGTGSAGGRGTANMEARAAKLRGSCTLGERDGGGCVLCWRVPLRR